MEETNYPNNSHASKSSEAEKPEKIEKVVTGKVKVKKKNEVSKLKEIFLSEDVHNVKDYVLMDVLIPALKKAVDDIISEGIHMLLYGGSKRPSGGSGRPASYVSYNNYSSDGRDRRDRVYSSDRRSTPYNYDEIIFETRGEAEDVLARMDELIDMYKVVTVADLYDLVGVTGNYTDNKYGWTNIRSAEAIRTRDGYSLRLPKPLPIQK